MRFPFVFDDGGRRTVGYRGHANDCACRSIAIATGQPYEWVAQQIAFEASRERPRKGTRRSHYRTGVRTQTIHRVLASLGWAWVPTMGIGTGCRVHVRPDELPTDRPLILNLSRHLTAIVDGAIHDTHDPSRDGTRCVYGYWHPSPGA